MGFSDRLIELRKRSRLTQGDLAERLGVSRQSVSKWETGESFPDLPKLVQLADILGVSLDVLCVRTSMDADIGGEEDPKPGDTADQKNAVLRPKRKRRALPLILLAAVLLIGGLAGFMIGRSGNAAGPEGAAAKKIPDNLRTTHVDLFCSYKWLDCSFYVNYYSDTARFNVTLLDEQGEHHMVPRVEKDGYSWVTFPTEKLSIDSPMKLVLTVTEGDAQRTVGIAENIQVTETDDPTEWIVSFDPGTDQ